MRARFALAIIQYVQSRLHVVAKLAELLLQRFHHRGAVFVGPDTIVDEALKLDHTPAEDWIRGVEDMHTAAQMMVMRAHHGDVIFTVGAGDITQMDEVILHALQAHRWDCEG